MRLFSVLLLLLCLVIAGCADNDKNTDQNNNRFGGAYGGVTGGVVR
ncbi:MAG TPA: hypothetical protein VM782_14530 [Stellaceae bacterium]|nr:hypothetical protein [Stellaceae bacterium]